MVRRDAGDVDPEMSDASSSRTGRSGSRRGHHAALASSATDLRNSTTIRVNVGSVNMRAHDVAHSEGRAGNACFGPPTRGVAARMIRRSVPSGSGRRCCVASALLLLVACGERTDQAADPGTDTTVVVGGPAIPGPELGREQDAERPGAGDESDASSSATQATDPHAMKRRMSTTSWRTRWKRGGRRQDTVLRAPTFAAASSEMIYVLDRDPNAVVAFRLTDGSIAWHSDTLDAPHIGYPRDIAIRPNGEVVILDDRRRMIHRVTPNGGWRVSTPLAGRWTPFTVCVPDDTSFVLYTLQARDPLVRVDTLGRVLARYPVPWDDLKEETSIVTQSRLATGPGGECVLALHLGRGFATMNGASVITRQPYVEMVQLPTVIRRTWEVQGRPASSMRLPPNHPRGALSAAVRDSTIFVLFGGLSEDRYRVIDSYDLVRGTYRESWRLPIRARAIATAPDHLLVLGTSAGYPTLLSLTAR